jgi:hypothetical protein
MAFHQWLSSAPKHHLTSSTADGFASSKSNTARPCSQQPLPGMTSHARRHTSSPSNLVTMTDQAPSWNVYDSGIVAGYKVSKHPAVAPPAAFQPITPPVDIDDVPQYGGEMYALFPDQHHWDTRTGLDQMGYSSRIPSGGSHHAAPPSVEVRSRVCASGNHHNLANQKAGGRGTLPSPPSSPQPVPRQSSVPKHGAQSRPASSRPKSNKVGRSSCNDPMLHTSTDPHYWAVNCTVLKADTNIEIGNVTSPTCMIGLPFGGMVEMALPMPSRESAASYRSV